MQVSVILIRAFLCTYMHIQINCASLEKIIFSSRFLWHCRILQVCCESFSAMSLMRLILSKCIVAFFRYQLAVRVMQIQCRLSPTDKMFDVTFSRNLLWILLFIDYDIRSSVDTFCWKDDKLWNVFSFCHHNW